MNWMILSTTNRHFMKLQTILKNLSTETSNLKFARQRRHIQSSMASLQRHSINLIKKEKHARLMRMKIDKIRRQAACIMLKYKKSSLQDNNEPIDVVDSENSELVVTQDDLDGEEQLERMDNGSTFDSGIELSSIYEKSSINQCRINDFLRNRLDLSINRDTNSDPIDLSLSSSSNEQLKLLTPIKNGLVSMNSSTNPYQIENNHPANMTTSTPIMNNLPSRRSTDDHLEQFMRVDPNQNIKWKQLADKFNKELGPNVCGVCHKTLSCKSALTMHYRVHTEERPFVCTVCEKRFSTKGNLKTHLGQHSDITDQFCVNNSLVTNQFKPGSMMIPPAMQSPTMVNAHSRISMPHGGFNLPFPGFPANPQAIFNMLNSTNEVNMMEAIKASQKPNLTDMNANCIVKQEDMNNANFCIICRQAFQSKFALELHLRVHPGGKEVLGCFPSGRHPTINWRERFQSHQQPKSESENAESKTENEEVDINHNTGMKKHQDFMNSSERFSLPSIIGLPNPAASMFSFMNNPSLLHRHMLPFPGLALANHLASVSNHSVIPRFSLPLGSPINGFAVTNLSENELHK